MALRLIGRKFIGFEKALERQAQAFAEIGGTEVELNFLEAEELYQRMVAGDGCTSGEYDLFLTVTDWYPTLIAGSAVRGLNAFIEQEPPPDWHSGWPASLLSLQRDEAGELFGMPYHDGPEMLIYRRDLFESEARSSCSPRPWEGRWSRRRSLSCRHRCRLGRPRDGGGRSLASART